MTIELALFYLLSAVTVGCAVMVIASRNPVHSVLFLILAFFNSAGLFLLLGAEFLAMILVVVYVGAVAVLFLFVVMMLDVNFRRLREGARLYWPIGALVGVILLAELILVTGGWAFAGGFQTAAPIPSGSAARPGRSSTSRGPSTPRPLASTSPRRARWTRSSGSSSSSPPSSSPTPRRR